MSKCMKKLKVLILHWGRRGGGPRYTLELSRVLSMRDDIAIYLSLSCQSELYSEFSNIPTAGRFDIDTYETAVQFGLRSLKLPLLRRRLARYVQEQKIDVVFCTMDHLWNPFVMGAVHDSGAIYLLTVHDATRHPGEDQGWRRWLLRRDIYATDAALTLTRSVGESLRASYGYPVDRIFFSALGHHGDRLSDVGVRQLPTCRPPRLLFFGRLLPYKGLAMMLEALPILRDEFPLLEMEVWGYGDITPYQADLDAVGGVRVENRWIEESEISGIFARNDIAVLPYREASQSGIVANAFAVGMPCVVTPIPGLCEQVIDGVSGVVSADNGPVEYAKAVARILRDPAFYAHLSQGCLDATTTTMSWERIGESVVDALRGAYSMGRRDRSG